jgi:3-oxoacyl-[acyl-carrier protein] reductase
MTTQGTSTDRPLPQALSLVGRRIAVTGAASGIGRATAFVAAQLGADLLLNDRASLAEVRSELERSGTDVKTREGDLTAPGFIDKFIADGPIDGLAHCAGILSRAPLNEDVDPTGRFHRTIDVNVRVPVELGQALIEHMAQRGGGAIVMIGSVAGRTGGTSMSTPLDYAASKGALHTAIRWLSRRAVGRGVMVNGIAPGPIDTPMTADNSLDPTALPIGRKGRPEEIGWMTMLLLTPAASYVSGTIVDCNGGAFVG